MTNVYLATPADVARVVHEERVALGLSTQALSQRAGVTPRFVEALERGDSHTEMAGVLNVLDALDVRAVVLPSTAPESSIHEIDLDAVIALHE